MTRLEKIQKTRRITKRKEKIESFILIFAIAILLISFSVASISNYIF